MSGYKVTCIRKMGIDQLVRRERRRQRECEREGERGDCTRTQVVGVLESVERRQLHGRKRWSGLLLNRVFGQIERESGSEPFLS